MNEYRPLLVKLH
jgi:hypothetical protein